MEAGCTNLRNGQYLFEVTCHDSYTGAGCSADDMLLSEFKKWKKANPKLTVKSVIKLPGDAILVTTENNTQCLSPRKKSLIRSKKK